YQSFRMGFYATLVPSTALAKDAGGLHFGQGWTYATNFITPYRLWLTAVLVVATIVYPPPPNPHRPVTTATLAMLAPAAGHALYITAIGGDYMHGRLLLPAFFAFALPASAAVPLTATEPADRRIGRMLIAGVTVVATIWALVSVVAFRPPPNKQTFLVL